MGLTVLFCTQLDNAPTVGSMVSSDAQKRRYAHESWAFNQRDPLVRKMFPELLESPEPLPELPPAPGASHRRRGAVTRP